MFERNSDPLFQNGSVRVAGGCLGFVYKAAAEIGELGDNTRALRTAIADDSLLRLALAHPDARLTGARPHPLGQRRHHQRGQLSPAEQRRARTERRRAVHGRRAQRRRRQPRRHQGSPRPPIAGPITTDAKVIPSVMARHVGRRCHRSR